MLVFFVLFVLGNNGVYSFLTSRGSRRKGYNVASVASSVASGSATSTQPADLTPAVDKFMSVPPGTSPALPYFMTAKGPSPAGPDPFALVADELQPLSEFVKELVKSENPVLTMAASHFFDQVRCAPPSFISAAPPHLPPPKIKNIKLTPVFQISHTISARASASGPRLWRSWREPCHKVLEACPPRRWSFNCVWVRLRR